MRFIDLKGKEFGRLTVLDRGPNSGDRTRWYCRCACPSRTLVLVQTCSLRSGDTNSCGCYRREIKTTHGNSNTPEYHAHWAMISRCSNPRDKSYAHYGGRGIRVCDRWQDFGMFLKDMGSRPSSRHSIDRINNDGDYEPGNCRWATQIEQHNNCRSNRILTHNSKSQTLTMWSREIGVNPNTIRTRLARGWDTARALTEPVRGTS